MTRATSQDGNVIKADFRPRNVSEITINLRAEWLFMDSQYGLLRVSSLHDGKFYGKPSHFWADFTTGQMTTL